MKNKFQGVMKKVYDESDDPIEALSVIETAAKLENQFDENTDFETITKNIGADECDITSYNLKKLLEE